MLARILLIFLRTNIIFHDALRNRSFYFHWYQIGVTWEGLIGDLGTKCSK